jgi:hypothetical protein
MRDLTVADTHTYYVVAGDTQVLVHNCGGDVPGHPETCECGGEGLPTNGRGEPYPQWTDPRTGNPIHYPGDGLEIVPKPDRVSWGNQERGAYIKDWFDRGLRNPRVSGPTTTFTIFSHASMAEAMISTTSCRSFAIITRTTLPGGGTTR